MLSLIEDVIRREQSVGVPSDRVGRHANDARHAADSHHEVSGGMVSRDDLFRKSLLLLDHVFVSLP